MNTDVNFEHIAQDENSELTRQASSLIVRDLYWPFSDLTYVPDWADVLKRINQMDAIGSHYVINELGLVLGVVVLQDCIDSSAIKVVELVTDRCKRGAGYGRMLIQGAAREALNAGYTKLHLNSTPAAVSFYERLGFNHAEAGKTWSLEANADLLLNICDNDQ